MPSKISGANHAELMPYLLSLVSKYGINSAWLAPEILDGKIYFFNSSYYSYLECVDIATGAFVVDEKGELTHPLAKLNAKDAKTEADRIANEQKENK